MTSPLDMLPEEMRLAAFDELAKHAIAFWGIQPKSLCRIAYRENAVYEVKVANGRRVALRVHRHGYHTRATLASEFAWMSALIEAGVETARMIETPSGEKFKEVSTAAVPVPHFCDVLEWVEGRPLGFAGDLSSVEHGSLHERYETVGRLAAQIHNHSQRWAPPAGFERPHWDLDGCIGAGALWGPWYEASFLSTKERAKLQAAVSLVNQALEELGQARDVYGMVHADFVPDNLFELDGRVVVLDLDDAGFGWYLWELVTAVFWYLGSPFYTTALDGYLKGYRAVRPLSEAHLQLMPYFLLMRALVYMGWMHTRKSQVTAKIFTQRVRELSLALADRLLAGESEFRSISLSLTPLPEGV